jgi:hypothetical protein
MSIQNKKSQNKKRPYFNKKSIMAFKLGLSEDHFYEFLRNASKKEVDYIYNEYA